MRKVQQIAADDCLAAALASLLDLPLGVVPVFSKTKDGDGQLRCTQRWLERIGYTLVNIPIKGRRSPWRVMEVATPCIVVVKSTTSHDHAVLGSISRDGINIIHDPAQPDMVLDKYETVAVMLLVPALPRNKRLDEIRLLRE